MHIFHVPYLEKIREYKRFFFCRNKMRTHAFGEHSLIENFESTKKHSDWLVQNAISHKPTILTKNYIQSWYIFSNDSAMLRTAVITWKHSYQMNKVEIGYSSKCIQCKTNFSCISFNCMHILYCIKCHSADQKCPICEKTTNVRNIWSTSDKIIYKITLILNKNK